MDANQPARLNPQLAPAEFEANWDALVSAQTQLLSCTLDLTRQQLACIRGGELEKLRAVLANKQRLADRLATSAALLSALTAGPPAEPLSPTARQRCRQQQAAAIALYEQLFELERATQQLLNQRRTQTEQRAQTAAGANPAAAYSPAAPAELLGTRLDLSSSA